MYVYIYIHVYIYIFLFSKKTMCLIVQDGIPYWFVLVMVFGLCSPWCDHGVNRPMLSEVVAPQHRARSAECRG